MLTHGKVTYMSRRNRKHHSDLTVFDLGVHRSHTAPRQTVGAGAADDQGGGAVRRRLQEQVGRRQETLGGTAEEAARVRDGGGRQGQDHQRPQDPGMKFSADADSATVEQIYPKLELC